MTPDEAMGYDRPEEPPTPFDHQRDLARKWVMEAEQRMEEARHLRAMARNETDAVGRLNLKQARVLAADAVEYASLARSLATVADLFAEPLTVVDEYRHTIDGPLLAQAKQEAAGLMRTDRT